MSILRSVLKIHASRPVLLSSSLPKGDDHCKNSCLAPPKKTGRKCQESGLSLSQQIPPKCIAKTKSPKRSLPFLDFSMAMITSNACRSACELRSWSTKTGVNAPDVSSNASILFPTTCLLVSLRRRQKQLQTHKNDQK